jgi:hypothetical protein
MNAHSSPASATIAGVQAPRILSLGEAAPLAGLSRRQLRHLAMQGRVPGAIKKGDVWVISEQGLQKFLSIPRPYGPKPRRRRAQAVPA